MGVHPLVRPLGLLMAILGIIQGVIWASLYLVSVLQYSGALDGCSTEAFSHSDLIISLMCKSYMEENPEEPNNLIKASNFFIFSIMCFVVCLLWIAVSCFEIWGVKTNKWAIIKIIYIVWITIVSVVLIQDLIMWIMLAIDTGKLTSSFNKAMNSDNKPPNTAYAQIFSMHIVMFIVSKGYAFFMVDVAVIIYVILFLTNDELKESPMFDRESNRGNELQSSRIAIDDPNTQMQYANPAYYPDDDSFSPMDNPVFLDQQDEISIVPEQEVYRSNWSKHSSSSLSTNSQSDNFARVGKSSKTPILGLKIPPPRIPTPDYSESSIRSRPGSIF